jgi:hypothetical protein
LGLFLVSCGCFKFAAETALRCSLIQSDQDHNPSPYIRVFVPAAMVALGGAIIFFAFSFQG